MATTDPLEVGVHQPLSEKGQLELLNLHLKLSVNNAELNNTALPFASYFAQYEKQCVQLSTNTIGKLKHRHIVLALDLILTESKATCLQRLANESAAIWQKSAHEPGDLAEEWLAFTAKHLLLMSISEWQAAEQFQDYARRYFEEGTNYHEKIKLPQSFHFRSLEKICGMNIRWTSVISEHLELDSNDTRVAVFHSVSMLRYLVAANVFEKRLVSDTEISLALFLPPQNNTDFRWFEKRQRRFRLDPNAFPAQSLTASRRQIRHMGCWRQRIGVIKETYDDHEPDGFFQNLRDTRKPARVWAFWAAVLIFFFGLVQCVLSAMQVYKAYHPS